MNYIGSKLTLLPFLEEVFRQVTDGSERVFCDLFAGTGAVGRHFKKLGLQVLANDLQYYAYALNKAYLEINETPVFTGLQALSTQDPLSFINALPGVPGFITNHYSPVGGRQYYTAANAQKADAIRQAMEQWRNDGVITEQEYFYVLCSLLEAIDQVANTASVYGAYLKQFKASALRPLQLKPLQLTNHVSGCRVWHRDANELIEEIVCDVLYLDPPYNHRQYGANYHVLETIAAYDTPHLQGVTGMRAYSKSDYCRKDAAYAAMETLIRRARTKHILVSYNDEGVMSLQDIQELLSLRGKPQLFQTNYNRFKADNGREYKRDATIEYVHYVRCMR
ncbi:MAG TPA: DNA adenine methylase [Blastocatellia bacterium]|nr:DNA adenine methylase [Blastocatellia bacterium]